MEKPSIFERLKNALFGTSEKKPTPSKVPAPAPAKKEIYVHVTVKGKKFHYDPCCPPILNAKTVRMELSKARKAGYTACDKCCYSYLHDD